MTTQHIKKLWREVADEYLRKFCEALGIGVADAFWVAADPGTIAQVGDYFVGINEMRFLVDNNIDPKVFYKWYDYSLDIHSLQSEYNEIERFTTLRSINFESFAMGAPKPYSDEEIERMKESLSAIKKAKDAFTETIKEFSNEV